MAESVLVFLREYESVPDGLKTRILSEKDVEKLDQWVRIAARSQSIEEFRERAGIKTDR